MVVGQYTITSSLIPGHQINRRSGRNATSSKPATGTKRPSFQNAGHSTVHFAGSGNNDTVSIKKLFKTALTAALLGSGMAAANVSKSSETRPENKEVSLWNGVPGTTNPFAELPFPSVAPAEEVSLSLAVQPQAPVDHDLSTTESPFKNGDMLDSRRQALALASAGQIADAPDALKLITGPTHPNIRYEILLKDGVTVGLSTPEHGVNHQAFLNSMKNAHQNSLKSESVSESQPNDSKPLTSLGIPLVMLSGTVMLLQSLQKKNIVAVPAQQEKKPSQEEQKITLSDVRGYPEVIRELRRMKDRYVKGNLGQNTTNSPNQPAIHVKPIKGLLLEGPPGTGKSMMARALAGESNVPFHYFSASQFMEKYVGIGPKRVRDLFQMAKRDADQHGGAIIFIDELDSIGGKRGDDAHEGGYSERTNTLNELLQQMSGFNDDPRIMIMGATNRADSLDDALKRSGRFDKIIRVDLPRDKEQRQDILDSYLSKQPVANTLDRDAMAELTHGKSGADIENLVNQMAEAATDRIEKAKKNAESDPEQAKRLADPEFHKLNTIDFMNALRNMEMGMRREARGTDEERKTVAVHEVIGHGLVARAAKTMLHIVSMQPRGDSLGHVMTDPRSRSMKLPTLESMLKELAINMGGRASERVMLGPEKITPGASSDIQQSVNIIRHMLATRMLSQASGANYHSHDLHLNEQDRKLADGLLKEAERTAEEVIRTVPQEKLWDLVNQALNLPDELEGEQANAFYRDLIETVGEDRLYQPIQHFIQKVANP